MNLSTSGQFTYLPFLDGLRGISILAVLAFHSGELAKFNLLKGGFLGVDIFFVISGFIITCLLMKEWNKKDAISLKHFYIRRCLRLLPALFSLLLIYFLIVSLYLSPADAIKAYLTILSVLFYISNWIRAYYGTYAMDPLGHTWSLAIEEQFYLLWPVVLTIALRSRISQWLLLTALIATVEVCAFHRAILWQGPETMPRLYNGFDTRLDALLIGCFVGLLYSWGKLPSSQWFIRVNNVVSSIAVIALIYFMWALTDQSAILYIGGFTLVGISIATILVTLLTTRPSIAVWLLENRILIWIGTIAYSLYLWHWPIFQLIGKINIHWSLRLTLGLFLSFLASAISYYFIEQPFLRRKHKYTAV
jgi:peptidoglycan/LPS O-acetylase OafA/YrhL